MVKVELSMDHLNMRSSDSFRCCCLHSPIQKADSDVVVTLSKISNEVQRSSFVKATPSSLRSNNELSGANYEQLQLPRR